MIKRISIISIISLILFSSNIFSQNILPNYGFEKHKWNIPNDKINNTYLGFCSDDNVIDSCKASQSTYFNKIRAKSFDGKGSLICTFKNIDKIRRKSFNGEDKDYEPFRGNACVAFTTGSHFVFTLKKSIIKDSIYEFSCYINYGYNSKIDISPKLNFLYCNNTSLEFKKLRALIDNTPSIKSDAIINTNAFWVIERVKFKAKTDASNFVIFDDNMNNKNLAYFFVFL